MLELSGPVVSIDTAKAGDVVAAELEAVMVFELTGDNLLIGEVWLWLEGDDTAGAGFVGMIVSPGSFGVVDAVSLVLDESWPLDAKMSEVVVKLCNDADERPLSVFDGPVRTPKTSVEVDVVDVAIVSTSNVLMLKLPDGRMVLNELDENSMDVDAIEESPSGPIADVEMLFVAVDDLLCQASLVVLLEGSESRDLALLITMAVKEAET
jgi:hypothetical protein